MTRLIIRILCVFFAVTTTVTAFGQAETDVLSNQQLANARALVRESQEAFVREELRLTAAEDAAFWPLYKKYRADMLPTQDRYVALIAGYMRQYQSGVLTDDYAEQMLDDYFDIKGDLLRTREKYIRQFRKILPMAKVARFYQLENKLSAEVDAELALVVPLFEAN